MRGEGEREEGRGEKEELYGCHLYWKSRQDQNAGGLKPQRSLQVSECVTLLASGTLGLQQSPCTRQY